MACPRETPALLNGPHASATQSSGYQTFLSQFHRDDLSPFVFQRPIAFTNGTDRANWRDYILDAPNRATFSEFWNERKNGKTTWIGLFITLTQSTVGVEKWWELPWHCWGVAVIKDAKEAKGKHILIYDCDPFTTEIGGKRRKELLNGYQEKFVKYAESQAKILCVWYNIDDSRGWRGQCVANTCSWIASVAGMGDKELADGDERISGFRKFDRR